MASDKIECEAETLRTMIGIYCKQKHKQSELCDACRSLLTYAEQRLSKCPFAPDKPFCKHCTIHCYKPQARKEIRRVMRYASPRMIFHYPWLTIKHVLKIG
ncbi:MAG: hypothetical protein H6Q17_179 [Bacteroidetes bacterium]|nr:hypothetical protein [Bacteroidota bacterium]